MLEKAYDPQSVEPRWGAEWAKAALAHCEPAGDPRNRFVIVIPPPNVTGALHIGHALNNTLQDVLVRHNLLHGRKVCWIPGTDHGGIATQNVMEKQLRAEKLTRRGLGRTAFLERMHAWTRDCKKTILGQLDRLGCLLDLPREAFTMDEARARAVFHAFESFWKEGLIYRGERMVNWCVRCGTALSDIEVEHEEREGHLWHFRYPFADRPGEGVVVATTRPETMLGDACVAVHPDDERHRGLVGSRLRHPFHPGLEIPVVADSFVDPSFGTGAVKVTPAHDPNDYEAWSRHKAALPAPVRVIDDRGRMTPEAGPEFSGLSREEARKKVLNRLEEERLFVKGESHRHSVGVCYRCQQAVEPLVSEQWFMRMEPLAGLALKASERGDFRIFPAAWEGPYRDWLGGIQDWCLSRQIWWGHRIPVWYCARCHGERLRASLPCDEGRAASVRDLMSRGLSASDVGERAEGLRVSGFAGDSRAQRDLKVQRERPGPCDRCGRSDWIQDPDVLDTWFSSALWPLSVFGWPEKTAEMRFFYPTSVLVTGYEILHLWVARMQMAGLWFEGRAPFAHCIINGIVRDKRGKKMSKSLGNVVDPLVMMDKYGTDAFRFSLVSQAHPGRDIPFSEDSLRGPRNFANKVWNSTRFVLMNLPADPPAGGWRLSGLDRSRLELCDRWILSEFQGMASRVRRLMDEYELAAASDEVYAFLWDKFCDWYVELSKPRLGSGDPESLGALRAVLVQVLSGTLKLLHPVMPFLTEELYQALKAHSGETAGLLLENGPPALGGDWSDPGAQETMAFVMGAVRSVRALRSQLNVPPALQISVRFESKDPAGRKLLLENAGYFKHLARVGDLAEGSGRPPRSATAACAGLAFHVPLAGVIDFERERERIDREVARLSEESGRLGGRLSDAEFLSRAPQTEVDKLRRRSLEVRAELDSLLATLDGLKVDG